jgi:hypothetical protein
MEGPPERDKAMDRTPAEQAIYDKAHERVSKMLTSLWRTMGPPPKGGLSLADRDLMAAMLDGAQDAWHWWMPSQLERK